MERLRKASAADPDQLYEQLKKAQDEYANAVRELDVKWFLARTAPEVNTDPRQPVGQELLR
jgi:hypothetical protein